MARRSTVIIPQIIERMLSLMIGQQCSLQRVANDKSLFVGFGQVQDSTTTPHAVWEIGTYNCAWRVVRSGKVICGRDDAIDDIIELKDAFANVKLGSFESIGHISEFDVRIGFSCGTAIDVLCTLSDNDQVLHIFFPEKEVATFSLDAGWRLGRSDAPWK